MRDSFVVGVVIYTWGALLGGIVGWWWRNETIPPRPLTLREKIESPYVAPSLKQQQRWIFEAMYGPLPRGDDA